MIFRIFDLDIVNQKLNTSALTTYDVMYDEKDGTFGAYTKLCEVAEAGVAALFLPKLSGTSYESSIMTHISYDSYK